MIGTAPVHNLKAELSKKLKFVIQNFFEWEIQCLFFEEIVFNPQILTFYSILLSSYEFDTPFYPTNFVKLQAIHFTGF